MKALRAILFGLSMLVWMPDNGMAIEIDAFDYPSVAAASRVWVPQAESPAIRRAHADGLTFPVPFAADTDRVFWDRSARLDLSAFDTIQIELTCPEPEALRALAIYFKSGDGWYAWSRPLREPGRQTITLMKSEFQTEGNPTGWHQIERIRVSPWKGMPVNTTLTLHRMAALTPSILILQADQPPAGEAQVARRTAQRISQWLGDLQLAHATLPESTVTAARLARARIVILPYNPEITPARLELLRTFVERGGRLMVFYSGDAALATLLGFRLGPYQAADGTGQWASFHFADARTLHVPKRVYQDSWNIRVAHPAHPSARVIAYWENSSGQRMEDPAWVQSHRGLWMSHILLPGDDRNKRELLAGLLTQLAPDLWQDIAQHTIARAGRIGPYTSFNESIARIKHHSRNHHNRRDVQQLLNNSEEQHRRLQLLFAREQFPQAVHTGRALQRTLLQAYAQVQSTRTPEWRAVWDHKGTGLYPGAWDRTAHLLAGHGINAIVANMLWGGVAHYDSRVLPRSNTHRLYGDQLTQCIEAARAHGLEVHVWIVCWNLTGAPPEFVARMRREGRLIHDADGQEMPWLNPAHPDNVRLMVDSLKEVANRYDIDGIHLDYIRYPHRRACYSDYTRQRFEEWRGQRRVARWPADALPGGPLDEAFRRFRVDQINLAVRTVHRELRAAHPSLKISAAVWGGYPDIIQSIAQDWAHWLEKGYVDFLTPMNYTMDFAQFMHLTRTQLDLPHAEDRIMPGIGVTSAESQLTPDQVIHQISGARQLGARGWILFDLNNTLRSETLPYLHEGITR
jgi:uncharacterized lipoprotein YddW (UPF0748 family)